MRKDADFDILCFDINIVGFFPTRVRLWPQNHQSCPPIPDIFAANSSALAFIPRKKNFHISRKCMWLPAHCTQCSGTGLQMSPWIFLANACSNQKIFTLNFLAEKIKVFGLSVVPDSVEIKPIDDYLKKDVKSMLFFHFCKNCMKIACSLNNPDEFDLIRGEKVWGN